VAGSRGCDQERVRRHHALAPSPSPTALRRGAASSQDEIRWHRRAVSLRIELSENSAIGRSAKRARASLDLHCSRPQKL
jgi:hypothetical protein